MSALSYESHRSVDRQTWRSLSLGAALAILLAPLCANAQPIIPGSTIARPMSLTAGQGLGFKARRADDVAGKAPILTSVSAIDVSRFAFTAPGKVPARTATAERDFQFTPSASGDRRPVSLAMATRTTAPATAPASQARAARAGSQIGPESYGFDLSIGWKGLALSGDVHREVGLGDSASEAVGLGVSYGGRGWRTGVRASAERGGSLLPLPDAALTERLSVEATGAVSVSPSVSLGGSVRYQPAPINPTLLDSQKDDRAVFFGGKVDF